MLRHPHPKPLATNGKEPDLPQQEANCKPGNGSALSAVEPLTRVAEVPQELERADPTEDSRQDLGSNDERVCCMV